MQHQWDETGDPGSGVTQSSRLQDTKNHIQIGDALGNAHPGLYVTRWRVELGLDATRALSWMPPALRRLGDLWLGERAALGRAAPAGVVSPTKGKRAASAQQNSNLKRALGVEEVVDSAAQQWQQCSNTAAGMWDASATESATASLYAAR